MTGKLEVSFNSPQCGWMSIGFYDGAIEFHTTTAHRPYSGVLPEILSALGELLENEKFSTVVRWNRDPEEFDFVFKREGESVLFEIIEFPTEERNPENGEKVYAYVGETRQFVEAFYETFAQLYAERNVDEFEQNWHHQFPLEEFRDLEEKLNRKL